MRVNVFITFLLFSSFVNAQEDLLNMLVDNDEPNYLSYLFKGTKVVNGQSVELTSEGVLQFNIQHRFGPLNSGLYDLYGLDNAQVRLSLDYGVKDWCSFSLGRSSFIKVVDMNSKIRLKRQVRNGFPAAIVFNSAFYIKQWKYSELDEGFIFANQVFYTNQILVASKINRNLTIQVSPTIVHYNLVEILDEPNDKYSLGIGGRCKLTMRTSINAEYFLQFHDKRHANVLSLGFDIETGGHVFQLHMSNSSAMIDPNFITKTQGQWLQGDIYFGFNISRVFTLHR